MQITNRLRELIEESDCDAGDAVISLLDEPDIDDEVFISAVREYLSEHPDFEGDTMKIARYIINNVHEYIDEDEDTLADTTDEDEFDEDAIYPDDEDDDD